MPQRPDDPYALLGVSPQATYDEVKLRYREKVKTCHPDLGNEPGRVEAFKQLTWAYRLLADPAARAAYDHGAGIVPEAARKPDSAEVSQQEQATERGRQLGEMLSAGRTKLASGNAAEAENLARLALLRDRNNADAYVLLGEALEAQARHTEAVGSVTLALQINPEHGDARRLLWRLRGEGQPQAAV